MSALCLNNTLVSEYLNYISQDSFDTKKVQNMLKYIQSFLVSQNQHQFFSDPSFVMQINNDPLLNMVDSCSEDELVKFTALKLQLVDKCDSVTFTQVNVVPILANSEKVDMTIGATFENATGKDKAIEHIKALLSDAKYINITDGYIEYDNNQWSENKNLLDTILPKKVIDITFIASNCTKKSELASLCSQWNIKTKIIGANIHDRYIETDKIKILLSSGLYHLSTNSQKDLTYMVKIK